MMTLWIGIALLSVSWLWGLGLYYPANGWLWTASLLGGAGCLCLHARRWAGGDLPPWMLRWSAALLVLASWLLPWPYLTAPLLLALGVILRLPKEQQIDASAGEGDSVGGRDWFGQFRAIANGLILAGAVLSAQAAAIAAYIVETGRNHDAYALLARAMAAVLGMLGLDASASGSTVFVPSLQQTHRLAVTWDWLVDPATWCFFIGAVAALAIIAWRGEGFRWWRTSVLRLAAVCAAWLPLKAMLMAGIYLQRVQRSAIDAPLHAMNHFFATWVLLTLLVVPAAAAWWFIRRRGATPSPAPLAEEPALPRWRVPAAVGLVLSGAAILALGTFWAPAGPRKEGRIKVVERHSTYEPTTKAYDTSWYGEPAGYNYALIYDQLAHYYTMSRLLESDAISNKTLADCDVLVIKMPTARYEPAEVAAVQFFVERGGGLLLIGDHTNYERGSTTMNDITRSMGFTFRDDLLFSFDDETYNQEFAPPWAAHPILQHVPPWGFAVSCSIDPGNSDGRAVIAGRGLFSMGPDYHMDNFHPVPQHCPEIRGGAFVQAWATDYGKGRVLAFTDSTIFSNFCLMQEGKADLMFGMVEWLNHARPLLSARPWLWGLGATLLMAGLWFFVGAARGAWLLLVGAILFGWGAGGGLSDALNRLALPPPKPETPFTQVVIDREISDAPLSLGPNTTGDGNGFGLFEQHLPRLGYFSKREKGDAVFSGDVLVVIQPDHAVSEHYRRRLVDYVRSGGKLLVVDSAENTASTANSLLWPFGISIVSEVPKKQIKGPLTVSPTLPSPQVTDALAIEEGESVARIGNQTVAAYTKFDRGAVLAIGCGKMFDDLNMGEHWMLEPTPEIRQRYEILYALVRRLVEDKKP